MPSDQGSLVDGIGTISFFSSHLSRTCDARFRCGDRSREYEIILRLVTDERDESRVIRVRKEGN